MGAGVERILAAAADLGEWMGKRKQEGGLADGILCVGKADLGKA